MTNPWHLPLALSVAMTVACTSEDLPAPGGDAAPSPPGFAPLVATDWSLAPGAETYRCVRWTAPTDLWLSAMHAVAPIGTHHTVLMVGPPDAPDGDVECTSVLTKPIIYGSGLGTQDFTFPDGVAIKIAAGQQLLLNLHLFNASSEPLTGRSGVEGIAASPDAVAHEAGVVLAGKAAGLTVPVGRSTQTGTCTSPVAATVFAVLPHMHRLGTHMKITYRGGAGERVLHDEDYSFDAQRFHGIEPALAAAPGDQLVVDCTYVNTTAATVGFGESTTDEMCFGLIYAYPPAPVAQCTR